MPKLEAQKFDFPKTVFQDLVELEPRVLDKPLSSSSVQKIIVEGLHEMSDYHGGFLKQIAANTKWDWKQWTLFGLAGVAAVASIIALFT